MTFSFTADLMQVTLQPLSHGASVQLDASPHSTVATLLSSYCTQKGIGFDRNLMLFDGRRRPLPQFSTLASLGVTNGHTLLIGYEERTFTMSERWPLIVAVGALIIGLVGIVTISMVYGMTGGKYPDDFGVVMDAGSSKTNTILYSWKSNKHKGTGCVSQIKTCLADGGIAEMDPMDLHEITECTGNLTKIVDPGARPKTPLYFAATAGMRLLNITNPSRVDDILRELGVGLNETGLSIRNIEIISGRDEGIYGWITVNFLEQTLELPQQLNPWNPTTYGALDMGGASMQVSYALPEIPENDSSVLDLEVYGQVHNVFSVSNLCFGRAEAEWRYRFLLVQYPTETNIIDPCLPLGYKYNTTGAELFGRPCTKSNRFKDILERNGYFANQIYTFIGHSNPQYCSGNVSKVLDNELCEKYKFIECFKNLDISRNQQYLAFASYFFTTDYLDLTQSSLEEYESTTTKFCYKTIEEVIAFKKSRFAHQMCFNAKYIHEVLINEFHFDNITWKNIHFVNEIAGKTVGWTLGYMIYATNIIPIKSPSPKSISKAALTVSLILFIIVIIATIAFVYHQHRNGRSSSEKPPV